MTNVEWIFTDSFFSGSNQILCGDWWSFWLRFTMNIFPSILESSYPYTHFAVIHGIGVAYFTYVSMNIRCWNIYCCQKTNLRTYLRTVGLINIVLFISNWQRKQHTATMTMNDVQGMLVVVRNWLSMFARNCIIYSYSDLTFRIKEARRGSWLTGINDEAPAAGVWTYSTSYLSESY